MITNTLALFAITCVLIELTPGPNMAYLIILSATSGRRAGLAATLGIAFGLILLGIAAAAGLARLVEQSPLLYHGLKWAGIVYFLFLAWETWKTPNPSAKTRTHPNKRFFIQGLITNLLNPKALLFYIAVLPNFIAPHQEVLTAGLMLTCLYVGIATSIHLGLVVVAGVHKISHTTPSAQQKYRRFSAIALVGIALWLAWSMH